jgi:hypothetical protein
MRSYTVVLCNEGQISSQPTIIGTISSARSSEAIVQMSVLASSQLPKLSVKDEIILLFLFIAFSIFYFPKYNYLLLFYEIYYHKFSHQAIL